LTDGADGPAGTSAGAEGSAPSSGRHPEPARAPRRYTYRQAVLAALAVAVLISIIIIERRTLAESLHVLAHLSWG
jgi:hypothetical protein